MKQKKALVLASVASMIEQFNMNHINLLLEHGFDVDVACNCKEGNNISNEKIEEMIALLADKGVKVFHVPIPRKISDVKGIVRSISQVKAMCKTNKYDLMHCHSPIGAVVARIAARGRVKKVIYTAHGFHFYKGAPLINWMIFYPIEKILSYVTDVLITINREDYKFAKKHMHAKQVEYVPGIGIDTQKFQLENFDKKKKRVELGIDDEDIMILSVGELNDNKNHEVVIRALSEIDKDNIHYFIAGKGDKAQFLVNLAEELNVNLHLLGYRTDIVELLNTADVYAFPSKREGLSVALMEAMAAGLPCVVSKIRGNVDLIEDGKDGYLCDVNSVTEFAKGISAYISNGELAEDVRLHARSKIQGFDVQKVLGKMKRIYCG